MDLNVKTAAGAEAGVITVSDAVFDAAYRPSLIHQIVNAYMAGARSGTRAQKNRARVRGGGIKPWRQKGTGRARSGTSRSPIWRSGGVTFAAQPQDYTQKVNRKMYRGAIRSILSELVRQERLIAIDEFAVDSPKTKGLLGKLRELGVSDALVITDNADDNLYLAARNLHTVDVCSVAEVDPVSLIGFEKVLVTKGALVKLQERLA